MSTFVEIDKVPDGLRTSNGSFMCRLVNDDGWPTVFIQTHHGHGSAKFRASVLDIGISVPNFSGHTRFAIDRDLALNVVSGGDFKCLSLPAHKHCQK